MKTDQAVSTLRTYVASKDKTVTAPIQEAAEEYHRACTEVNQYLTRVDDLLHRSFRGEAIHFANVEPRLEDLAALLDFPGRADYELVGPMDGLPVPGPLRMDVISNLQTTFAESQATEILYKSLRRMVLKKASVPERLSVLHEIWKLDPFNPGLLEDIGGLEKVLQTALVKEVTKAVRENNEKALEESLTSYYLANWDCPPLPETVAIMEKYRGRYMEARLKTLANRVAIAIQKKDFPAAKQNYEDWLAQAGTFGVQKGDRYWGDIEPLFHKIGEYDQVVEAQEFAQYKLLEFRQVVQSPPTLNSSNAVIDLLHGVRQDGEDAITAFNQQIPGWLKGSVPKMAIPKELDLQFHMTLERYGERGRKNETIILASLFAAGALALVSFLIWVIFRSRS